MYIKGEDYAQARMQGITDEIELYRKTKYISAAEATWSLLGFQMVDRNPAITKNSRAFRRTIFFVSSFRNTSLKPANHQSYPLTPHGLFRTAFSWIF